MRKAGADRFVAPMRWCLLASEGSALVAILAPGVFGPVFFVRGDGTGAALFWALQFALWIAICGLFAQKRGYSAVLGVAGLLLVPGFLLLALLPDRRSRRDEEELSFSDGA